MKQCLSLDKCTATGELQFRIHKSQARLEAVPYTPEACAEKDNPDYDWPGDWIGRSLLGNVLISSASGSESAYEDALVENVLKLRNEKGYLGHVQKEGTVDEQQLSGHNWLFRGLLEFSLKEGKREDLRLAARKTADDIVKNLYIPAAKYYASYPVNPEDRVFEGEKAGTLTGKIINHWKTSSDTGCAFMCLDGMADYFTLTEDREAKEMLFKMIEKFTSVDFTGIQMQTHASISATRGILKVYKKTGEEKLIEFAEKMAKLYVDFGMTANYENYNWFCRNTWTEPCAVVDSFIMFSDLFAVTGKTEYLKTARRIYYNGLRFDQRENGGFGTDKCADAKNPILKPDGALDKMNEAFWCCSMRGGEGMARVLQYGALMSEDGKQIYFTSIADGIYEFKGKKINFKISEKGAGNITIALDNSDGKIDSVNVYIPDYGENLSVKTENDAAKFEMNGGFAKITLPCRKTEIEINYDIEIKIEKAPGIFGNSERQGYLCFEGDTIIGISEEKSVNYMGIPDFVYEKGKIIDKKTFLPGEKPGRNIDCRNGDILENQSLRIVFTKQ